LPLPRDLHSLPTVEALLEQAAATSSPDGAAPSHLDVPAVLRAAVSPSPARAAAHDPDAWLPLPDVGALPPVEALRDPDPVTQAAVIAAAEAVVREAYLAAEAVVSLSPARAEPHDAATWLPLPDVHGLPEVAPAPPPRAPWYRRAAGLLPPGRAVFVAVLATATVLSVAWIGRTLTAPGGSSVTVLVDGSTKQIHTSADTVGALLAERHVHLARGDAVTPSTSTSLHDGLRIHVERGFPVLVDFDGATRRVMTTEYSVDALMKQMHVGKLVEARGDPGTLGAHSTVVFRTRHTGTLTVDGKVIQYDSASLNVDELLDNYSVKLIGDDRVDPAASTRLADGMSVNVVRVGAATEQGSEPIPFTEVRQPDPDLPIGQTREVQAGRDGVMTVTYRDVTENGTVTGRTPISKVPAVAAVPHVVAYGTQADWHWDTLAQCESGGKWGTVDPVGGYDGGLGIYRGTWLAFGGAEFGPNAGLATREQQIMVGERIQARYGWSAWGCGRMMHWG
jgi:uncharacterized protein YabE (DUF348 family)